MPQKIHPWNTKNRPAVGRISFVIELGAPQFRLNQYRTTCSACRSMLPRVQELAELAGQRAAGMGVCMERPVADTLIGAHGER